LQYITAAATKILATVFPDDVRDATDINTAITCTIAIFEMRSNKAGEYTVAEGRTRRQVLKGKYCRVCINEWTSMLQNALRAS
jgi:hypothetical protein